MQPKSVVKFDRKTFDRLKKAVNDITTASKKLKENILYASELPQEIGIQLLYNCNLRCKMCYQWNENGLFRKLNKNVIAKEISPEIVSSILEDTKNANSKLFLWGGEPFYHSQWKEIAKILSKYNRWVTICTNGILIEKNLETILPISENLVLLISLDGFEEQNDELRGKGTFKKVIQQIKQLIELRDKGIYKGVISINTVINNFLIPHLYDYAVFMESMMVDSVYLNFPWYISKKRAMLMDDFCKKKLTKLEIEYSGEESWKSYTYSIEEFNVELLKQQVNKINTHLWNMRLRFQPPLEKDKIGCFVGDNEETNIIKSKCFAVVNRIDIHADGSTGSCKFFPELAVGNIHKEKLLEIWHNKKFGYLRKIVAEELMPVCSKCVLLYLNGK